MFESVRRTTITVNEFLSSWTNSANGDFSDTSGKSGARFFFSADKKYLVKTISLQEVRWLIKILPAYTPVRI